MAASGNIVYAHIFDPDVVSLDVKVAMKTELLFTAYATVILDMARKKDKKELPAILSSSYCFEASDENAVINKLFALNSKVNKELHTRLPGAGYFSECNTLLLYDDEEYWKNLKFDRDGNEIVPIVKYLIQEGKKEAKFVKGAMQTSVPVRMRNWQNLRLDQDEQRYEVKYFLFLEECPQVPLKSCHWVHRVYSAISQYVVSSENKFLKYVGKLWKYFSPTLSFDKEFTMVDKISFRDFIQSGYDDHLQKNEAKLQNILETLKEYPLTEKGKKQEKLWDDVAETAKSCGNIYRNYIVSWWWDEAKSFNLNRLFDMENLS
ncbi:hypothetical protein P3T76_007607 [Phytophthora citrophthora]|uniref:Uncharacterized protein n=1 Tax=Phytophthora citrophthora TaxID=4793 RepID=A0AAD9GM00_9STRA|nr:hypothetical protein P3T76_007607 [Phytophthora citrophthora]